MKTYDRVFAEVDLDAIEANMRAMQENLTEGTGIIGVVKTDAYGHGSVPVAKTIDPYVRAYAVATVEEGIVLRRHGIKKPVLALGVTLPERFQELLDWNIRPSLFVLEHAQKLSELAVSQGRKAPVHIAVDTGMSRIGLTPDEAGAALTAEMAALPGILLEGMFTHFARADEGDPSLAKWQLDKYRRLVSLLKARGIAIPIHHVSNSAGIIDLREADLDMVRAGISIYGMYPSDEVEKGRVKLKAAMELKSYIVYVKTIRKGTPVSYGGAYVADRDTRVATIPVGYGDGYPRSLSGRGSVLIRGQRARILGRICMDQFMVDVTDIPEAAEGDLVTLMGRDRDQCITAEELADLGGGFHYELVCGFGKRIPRVYLRGGRAVGSKDYFDDRYEDFSGSYSIV